MKTITLANIILIGDFRKGEPYLQNNTVIIPGGIYGDTEILVKEAPQYFMCHLKLNDSASYNGWQLYNLHTAFVEATKVLY